MLKVAYDNIGMLKDEIDSITNFILKRFSVSLKRKHIALLVAKSCGWTRFKEIENVSKSNKSIGFTTDVMLISQLSLEDKQTILLKKVVLLYDLLIKHRVSKENAGICAYEYIKTNISFKEKLVMKLSNLKEYKISMIHPLDSLRGHSACYSSMIKGIRLHLKISELYYGSGSSSIWVTKTGSLDIIKEYIEEISDLPVREQVIQNKMLNSSEINYFLFVSNFELMLSSLTNIKPQDYRSAYLVGLLSQLFKDECAGITNGDDVKKIFNIDNMLEKLHDPELGIFYWELRQKLYEHLGVGDRDVEIPQHAISMFNYLINILYVVSEAYFKLFSDDSIVTVSELFPDDCHTVIKYNYEYESALACLFLNQIRDIRESEKSKNTVMVNLEQAKNHSHGNFSDRLKDYRSASMILNFFYSDETSYELRDSPKEFEQRNCRVDIKYDVISDSKTEIQSTFIKSLTDLDKCFYDTIR